jgi:hypothetical protein
VKYVRRFVIPFAGVPYQNLQIVVTACYAGGFATRATYVSGGLTHHWSVSTPRDTLHGYSWTFGPNKKTEGTIGLELGGKWHHGWFPQWLRKLELSPDAGAAVLADFAKTNTSWKGGNPLFEFEGTGNGSSVHDGSFGNLALVWCAVVDGRTEFDDAKEAQIARLYALLETAGYDDTYIDLAYLNRALGGPPLRGAEADDKPINRNATKNNLKEMLLEADDWLGSIPSERDEKKLLIVLDAHGNSEVRRAERKTGWVPNQTDQGKLVTPGGGSTLEISADFLNNLFEGVTVDDPKITRHGSPALLLTTSAETHAGPVTVHFDGVAVGTIAMENSPNGGNYQLFLPDSVLTALWGGGSGVLHDGSVAVTFDFPSGDFRIATEWDFEIEDLEHYGIGLAGPPVDGGHPDLATSACCLSNGTCLDGIAEASCTAAGGSYRGAGATCASGCPFPPLQRCCFGDGNCRDLNAADCAAAGGVAGGEGSICWGDTDGDAADDSCGHVAAAPDRAPIRIAARVHPNPAPGACSIVFEAGAGTAHVKVIDVGGRQVRSWSVRPAVAGSQRIDWDGRDDSGRAVRNGVYFVEIALAGRVGCLRVVIMR